MDDDEWNRNSWQAGGIGGRRLEGSANGSSEVQAPEKEMVLGVGGWNSQCPIPRGSCFEKEIFFSFLFRFVTSDVRSVGGREGEK